MSQENIEIVRAMYKALNRDDVEAFIQHCDTDFEVRDLPEMPGSGTAVGHDAVRRWWSELFDPFEELRFEPKELIDAGESIVGLNHGIGRGRGSGADVEMHFASVWSLTNGKVVSLVSYGDRTDAFKAAGLRE
jgi:ketosteroid isomerase-like protein